MSQRYDSDFYNRCGKNDIGVCVYLDNGEQLLFSKSSRWRHVTICGVDHVEVIDGDAIKLQAPLSHVVAVLADPLIVRDTFIKQAWRR